MRILVATDAWRPQVNGVVNTIERLAERALTFIWARSAKQFLANVRLARMERPPAAG